LPRAGTLITVYESQLAVGQSGRIRGRECSGAAYRRLQQLITRKVAGVFFAPLELTLGFTDINQKIANILERAKIPVVLLDRDLYAYPSAAATTRLESTTA
jgi:hypothetical protein